MHHVNDWLRSIGIDGGEVLGNSIITIAAFVVARWLGRRVRHQTMNALARRAFTRNDAILVGRMVSLLIYGLAVIVTLVAWGVNSTGILTALGAFSVALGLSLQDVFRNFFSGVLLLLEKPFRVGDHVQVQGIEGEVLGIDIRTTLVRTANGATVMVPNSIMYAQILTTRSGPGLRRLDLSVKARGIDTPALIARVEQSIHETGLARNPLNAITVQAASHAETTILVSVLVPDAPGNRETMVQAIMNGDADIELEVQVT